MLSVCSAYALICGPSRGSISTRIRGRWGVDVTAGLLDDLLTPLASALNGLSAVPPASLGERELTARAGELLRARDVVESLLAHTLAEATCRGLAGTDGHTRSWLGEVPAARHGRAEYARLAARSRVVAGLPLVAALHAGGEVSTAFVDAAGSGLRQLPAEAHPAWDLLLAGEARDCDPADIPKLLAHLRVMIDPDTVNSEADRAAERSELHVSPYGSLGSWAIRGTLRGVEGELVARVLAHYAKPRDAGDTRSRGERQAAALVQIMRIAERATTDTEFIPAPRGAAGHVIVHATTDTWHRQPGAPAATTENGTVIDPGQFDAMRCATQPELLLHTTDTTQGAGSRSAGTAGAGDRGGAGRAPGPAGSSPDSSAPRSPCGSNHSPTDAGYAPRTGRNGTPSSPATTTAPSPAAPATHPGAKPTTSRNGTPTTAPPTPTTWRWSAGNTTPASTGKANTSTHPGAPAPHATKTADSASNKQANGPPAHTHPDMTHLLAQPGRLRVRS